MVAPARRQQTVVRQRPLRARQASDTPSEAAVRAQGLGARPVEPGWWQANDDRWYPPELAPRQDAPPPPTSEQRPASVGDALVEEQPEDPRRRLARSAAFFAATALVTVLLLRFVAQLYVVPSSSMEPTLESGDRVIVQKLDTSPSRGDLVVFKAPGGISDFQLVKRVIAVAGDEVELTPDGVVLNGKDLSEPYVAGDQPLRAVQTFTVPDDHIFVLGDNRRSSRDGREFGPVHTDEVIGTVLLRVWPPFDFDL